MKKIVVLGAGRSSSALIDYLLSESDKENWHVTVADQSLELAEAKVSGHSRGSAVRFQNDNKEAKEKLIASTDLVISLLPPPLHFSVAECCLKQGKNLLTASYVSDEIQSLNEAARKNNILILMESGLDPGLDHMSAMKEINEIREKGHRLSEFYSYAGGLVSPESDTNPWHYKFTWNSRNVILAGQGTVKYLENKKLKFIPYHKLFERTQKFTVEGHGDFEGYANRDSLKYLSLYDLNDIDTFIRGTFRVPPFCSSWNLFVQLGMTSEAYTIPDSENITWEEFIESYLPESSGMSVKQRVADYLSLPADSEQMHLLESTGIFAKTKTGVVAASPADLLQALLEQKWKYEKGDKDMIVMQHTFIVEKEGGKQEKITSSLVVKGDEKHSAMSKTVGLPLGISTKLILQGKIKLTGVQVPTSPEIYNPVLQELAKKEVEFVVKSTSV